MGDIWDVRPITTKDIMLLTGRGERQACRMLYVVRKALGKKKGQIITVAEFCQYKGYDVKKVAAFLKLDEE